MFISALLSNLWFRALELSKSVWPLSDGVRSQGRGCHGLLTGSIEELAKLLSLFLRLKGINLFLLHTDLTRRNQLA